MMEGRRREEINDKPNNYLRMHSFFLASLPMLLRRFFLISLALFPYQTHYTPLKLPLRHNHTSVICDWWLDIKKNWESSNIFILLHFLERTSHPGPRQDEKPLRKFLTQSEKWSFQKFSFARKTFIGWLQVGLWRKKNIVPFPWFHDGHFRETFTGTKSKENGENKKYFYVL